MAEWLRTEQHQRQKLLPRGRERGPRLSCGATRGRRAARNALPHAAAVNASVGHEQRDPDLLEARREAAIARSVAPDLEHKGQARALARARPVV